MQTIVATIKVGDTGPAVANLGNWDGPQINRQ